MADSSGGNAADQSSSAQFFEGQNLSGQWENGLRAGAQLLFLPGSIGCLSDRLVSGSGGVVEIQLFLLHHRISYFARCAARPLYLRFSVSVRMVSGAAAQNSDQKDLHQKAEAADLHKIRCSAFYGGFDADAYHKRCWHGRSVFL